MSSQMNATKDEANVQGKLLSSQERQAFKMISAGDDLHGQRAIALLAVDEGVTQKEAGARSGLTPGQVKYWLGRFRQLRLEIFPEQVLENAGLVSSPLVDSETDRPKKAATKSQQRIKKGKPSDKKKKPKKKSKKKKSAPKKGKKSKKKEEDSAKKKSKKKKGKKK